MSEQITEEEQFEKDLANSLFESWGKLLGQYMMRLKTSEFEKQKLITQVQKLKAKIAVLESNTSPKKPVQS